jgi:hypothetical protein
MSNLMRTNTIPRTLLRSIPILVALFAVSCGGTPNPAYVLPNLCMLFDNAPLTALTAPDPNDPSQPQTVFEQVGQLKVMHGFGTAKLPSGKNIIKVEQSVALPGYANQAAVFLNGWKLDYLGSDQNVLALGSIITKIKLDRRSGKLTWNAAGLLRDDDFEEGYEFTYNFTVIAWNDVALNISIDQGNPDNICNADTDLPDKSFLALSNGPALSAFSAFANEPAFPANSPIVILPRGFGFSWYDGDHHMLQLGYNLEHSEGIAVQDRIYNNNRNHVHTLGDILTGISAPLPNLASHFDSGLVSWNTLPVMKDNDSSRYYLFSEMTSAIGGHDIGLIQPPFSIIPKPSEGGGSTAGGVLTKDFVIENIPYEFAVPMLTGWELSYLTDDQHVKEAGIWIDKWSYTPGSPGGTLRYKVSSILRDDDSTPAHLMRSNITVLGIHQVTSKVK